MDQILTSKAAYAVIIFFITIFSGVMPLRAKAQKKLCSKELAKL